jgi:hypothetical protein
MEEGAKGRRHESTKTTNNVIVSAAKRPKRSGEQRSESSILSRILNRWIASGCALTRRSLETIPSKGNDGAVSCLRPFAPLFITDNDLFIKQTKKNLKKKNEIINITKKIKKMKKLIFTVIILVGFQFTQAQEVTEIAVVSNGALYSLDGSSFAEPIPKGGETIQIIVEITNTGNDDLFAGDMIECDFLLNDSVIVAGSLPLADDLPKNEVAQTGQIAFPLAANNIKSGTNANRLCVKIPRVTVRGVWKEVNSEYCASFSVYTVGINDIGNLKEVNVFPNPVRDNHLKIENVNESTDISLYDIRGQLIQSQSGAMGNTSIDVAKLSNGIYMLKIQSGKNIRTEKIQIIR